MGHHERFRSELAVGFEEQKKKANRDGDVLLSIGTEDKTSASWSTAAATGSELFNDWGRRGYADSVPGEVTKTPSSGDRTT